MKCENSVEIIIFHDSLTSMDFQHTFPYTAYPQHTAFNKCIEDYEVDKNSTALTIVNPSIPRLIDKTGNNLICCFRACQKELDVRRKSNVFLNGFAHNSLLLPSFGLHDYESQMEEKEKNYEINDNFVRYGLDKLLLNV